MINRSGTEILSEFVIKEAVSRNRLAVAPMTRISASAEGRVTPIMRDYYLRFAKGGFGLITTEGLYTDKAFSQGYLNQPGLADEKQALGWAGLNAELQAHGALVFAQLMHAGALSQGNPYRSHTIAPSAVQPVGEQMQVYYGKGLYATPSAMTEAEIEEVIRGFAKAAARAVRVSGFDGIEIHGANGYLLDQFLGASTNQRTDRWGGDINGRITLLVEIIKAVKREVGEGVPVGIRISQGKVNDFQSKWPGGQRDADVIFSALATAGADFIHVTEYEAWQPAFEQGPESLVAMARRYAPGVSLIANGSLHTRERIAAALADGADMVSLGRGALSNPDFANVLENHGRVRAFDSSILGPVADIKAVELLG